MTNKEIGTLQINLIKKCKNYLINEKKKNIDISISPLCFFTTWANSPGFYQIQRLNNKKKTSFLFFAIKNFLSIYNNLNLDINFNKFSLPSKKTNVIVSYSLKGDFNKNGTFYDKYFDYNSKNKKFFWILISLDGFIPKKLDTNIAIICNENKNVFSKIYYFTCYLLKLLKNTKLNINKVKHYFWQEFFYAKHISSLTNKIFNKIKINNFILNYEGIPFQNYLIKEVKRNNSKILIYGYLHCAPWPLQLDLIYKGQKLDKFIVSSLQQKKILCKYLGWKNSKIKVIPSLRFKKEKKKKLNGYLFVPYNLKKNNDYLYRLKDYLSKIKENNKINYSIRIHPLNNNSKKHINFRDDCNEILNKFSKKTKKTINNSLFFGSATGVCIQALEEGTTITHFPDDTSEVFTNKIWPTLKIKQLGNSIYEYKLLKINQTFLVKKDKNKFKKYFMPLLNK